MDRLDTKLMRELSRHHSTGPFPSSIASIRKLANALQVDKETVRTRLSGLQEKGILVGWHALVNPNTLSMKVSRSWIEFRSEAAKDEVVRKLSSLPRVRIVYDYVGAFASFVTTSNIDQDPDLDAEVSLLRSSASESFTATMRFPKARVGFDQTDWKIYELIRSNPQKPQQDIANETGLGLSTVKRHLDRMTEEKMILVAPNFDASKIEGVSADLLVECGENFVDGVEQDVETVIGNLLIHVEQFQEPHLLFTFIANNISEAKGVQASVRSVPGVHGSHLYFVQGITRVRIPLRPSAWQPEPRNMPQRTNGLRSLGPEFGS